MPLSYHKIVIRSLIKKGELQALTHAQNVYEDASDSICVQMVSGWQVITILKEESRVDLPFVIVLKTKYSTCVILQQQARSSVETNFTEQRSFLSHQMHKYELQTNNRICVRRPVRTTGR